MNGEVQKKIIFICGHCGQITSTVNENTYWKESAGGSYKLCNCETCGSANEIRYVEDPHLDVNNDPRYY